MAVASRWDIYTIIPSQVFLGGTTHLDLKKNGSNARQNKYLSWQRYTLLVSNTDMIRRKQTKK